MNKTYFTQETITFYDNLRKNNNKEWFAENRHIYDTIVIPQAKEYIMDMGQKLSNIVPNINYMPKIDGSIFRIHKDARLNKGKAPFKAHLGIIFWLGISRLESPSFYLHIEPPFYYTGVGMARFEKNTLLSYRKLVNNQKYTKTLENIKNITEKNYYTFMGDTLKNIPKNMVAINNIAEFFLKYKYLYIHDEMPINKEFYSHKLFDYTYDIFYNLLPFFNFLKDVVEDSKK